MRGGVSSWHLPCRISQPEPRSGSSRGPPARPRPPQWPQATELQVMHGSKVRMGLLGAAGAQSTPLLGCPSQTIPGIPLLGTRSSLAQPLGLVPIPARSCALSRAGGGRGGLCLCLCLAGGGSPHAAWLVPPLPLSAAGCPPRLSPARSALPASPAGPRAQGNARAVGKGLSLSPPCACCMPGCALSSSGDFCDTRGVGGIPRTPSCPAGGWFSVFPPHPVLSHRPLSLPRPPPRTGHPPPHARCPRTLCC